MGNPLIELSATNFLSLARVQVPLGPLSVLVGPNASGKTNVLKIIQFLGAAARDDLGPAVTRFGGFGRLQYRGKRDDDWISVGVKALLTKYAHSDAPDEYTLSFKRLKGEVLVRHESFTFKRRQGPGRRLTVSGSNVSFGEKQEKLLRADSLALSTLPRLAAQDGGEDVEMVARLFTTFRVFEPDVARARQPSADLVAERLADDASNLAAFLVHLRERGDVFDRFVGDARSMVPGLEAIEFASLGGPTTGVSIELKERGLSGMTRLSEASYGTVRALALLAVLHDPKPPPLTCIEEIDHGLHPHVFDVLVERMREASERSQLLVATHSPALVNRLDARELIVCERDEASGASRIPAISADQVVKMLKAAKDETGQDFRLGELWFAGSLGGVPRQ